MGRLNPEKLHVTYIEGATPGDPLLPRRYTLTHSDRTGELFLSVGVEYNLKQISGLYTRLMRDEVLSELVADGDILTFKVYCHVSGGFVFGMAKWRYSIFHSELPLVLEAIRHGDRIIFKENPQLDNAPVLVYFRSTNTRFNKVENWGPMLAYSS